MSSANKARGTRYETELVEMLNNKLFEAQRLARAGAKDEGDVEVRLRDNLRLVIEAKNHKSLALADWLKQADVEADNREEKLGNAACIPVVFAKRRGKNAANSYVIMDATEFLLLLKMVGE
jgi:hypothetical protein